MFLPFFNFFSKTHVFLSFFSSSTTRSILTENTSKNPFLAVFFFFLAKNWVFLPIWVFYLFLAIFQRVIAIIAFF